MAQKRLVKQHLFLITVLVLCLLQTHMTVYAADTLRVAYKSNNPYYVYEDSG